MTTTLAILAGLYLLWTTHLRNGYTNKAHGWDNNFGHYLGTLMVTIIEGGAWYLIFKALLGF